MLVNFNFFDGVGLTLLALAVFDIQNNVLLGVGLGVLLLSLLFGVFIDTDGESENPY